MKPDASHIRHIRVVSNTHWDREFRRSFERTRRRLVTMMDVTLDILESDPAFPSFTMDGHSIMIDDYLEIRPERRDQVARFIHEGRLIIGPWYTLPETQAIGHEPLVRNFLWGRQRMEHFGAPRGTVAYTPASWGQSGQMPQILLSFGLTRTMFYRGISHHETDAEFIWEAPDGSRVMASRFALYARYNWYYQVHRAVTRGRTFSKDYTWGEYDEVPFRFADGLAGEDLSFDVKVPSLNYDKGRLRKAIEDMVAAEGPHFTTPVFLAMHGHDISVAHPLESRVIADAKQELAGTYDIEHTDLESYWNELERHLDPESMTILRGERRQHLRKGMWTYLFPASISARTYLKQQDFDATTALVYTAEPLASLATVLGDRYPETYLRRGWSTLLSVHTHDANGGVAPDAVCLDMEYRYRKTQDIAAIVTEDSMAYVASHLSPRDTPADAMQLVVFNPLPFERDEVALVDVEIPRPLDAKAVRLESARDTVTDRQPVSCEKSSAFVDSIWDVPTILDSHRLLFHARFRALPGLGYRVYQIIPEPHELRSPGTMIAGPDSMENEYLHVKVNGNGSVTIRNKETGRVFENLNHLIDQGESGNGWRHVAPRFDRVYTSLGLHGVISIVESGPLVCRIAVEYEFPVPEDYADGESRSGRLVPLPIRVEYRLEHGSPLLKVRLAMDNRARDHWLRACFPTGLDTKHTIADSHFDVVYREIAKPDSTGWVERFEGTHPLRTFVAMGDSIEGLAVLTKGLFEYEGMEDAERTLAVTLLRACRIKLAVSEEKQTELSDQGVQCPGPQCFEYAVYPFAGDWVRARVLERAAAFHTPLRLAMIGRGRGEDADTYIASSEQPTPKGRELPLEAGLFVLSNPALHVTAVKAAEDGDGLIVRVFNGTDMTQKAVFAFGMPLKSAHLSRMDESEIEPLQTDGQTLAHEFAPRKIHTYRLQFEDT